MSVDTLTTSYSSFSSHPPTLLRSGLLRQRCKDDHDDGGPEEAIAQHPISSQPMSDPDRGLQNLSESEQMLVLTTIQMILHNKKTWVRMVVVRVFFLSSRL